MHTQQSHISKANTKFQHKHILHLFIEGRQGYSTQQSACKNRDLEKKTTIQGCQGKASSMRLAMAQITMNNRHPKETVKKMQPYMTLQTTENSTQHTRLQQTQTP